MSIKTKTQWKEAVEKAQEELKHIPKETEVPNYTTCTHDRGEYGNCTCVPSYVSNWKWGQKERELRDLLSTYVFCECGRRTKPHHSYCPSCGAKAKSSMALHKGCTHWNPQLRFCPDCAQPSVIY